MSFPDFWKDPITAAITVIAAATVVNLVAAAIRAWSNSRLARAITRPYLSVKLQQPIPHAGEMRITFPVEVKNVGNTPALDASLVINVKEAGRDLFALGTRQRAAFIPPREEHHFTVHLGEERDFRALRDRASVGFVVSVFYKGADGGKYVYEYEAVYRPTQNRYE